MEFPMNYIIGVDEVGRGPLAGPVTVCAALFPERFPFGALSKKLGVPLRDSKKLSRAQRETWARYLKTDGNVLCAITSMSAGQIDRMNIRNATNRAVEKALSQLFKKKRIPKQNIHIYMDGGLAVSTSVSKELGLKHKPQSIIRGDATVPQIAAASILAKVSRDRYMTGLSKKYPRYGFERHKGYGTVEHYRALRRHGPSPIHRRSFLRGR